MKSNDRFNWALSVLRIQPGDEVLEIGCGTGRLAGMVARRLVSGHITAIDISVAMISKAKTNIQSDKTRFLSGQLGQLKLPEHHFSKAYAFNVGGFWKPGGVAEIKALGLHLKANGAFYLFHQPPISAKTKVIAEESKAFLEAAGFNVEDVLYKDIEPALASCIISRPSHLKKK